MAQGTLVYWERFPDVGHLAEGLEPALGRRIRGRGGDEPSTAELPGHGGPWYRCLSPA